MAVRLEKAPVQNGNGIWPLPGFSLFLVSTLLMALPLACNDTQSDPSSDSALECERNSDCSGTLVCSPAGRCIDQCNADKDCPAGQRCQSAVCVVPDAGTGHRDTGTGGDEADAGDANSVHDTGHDSGNDSGGSELGDVELADASDAGLEDAGDGGLPDASDAGGDTGPGCDTGLKRCSLDSLTVQICIGGAWKDFDACAQINATCQDTDAGSHCVSNQTSDAGGSDSGTIDGGSSDAGKPDGGGSDAAIDCAAIDYTKADQFCADLAVPICDLWKQCSPGDFSDGGTDGGMTIEFCRESNAQNCDYWNRMVMCCPGVTFDQSHSYECLSEAMAMNSCYAQEPTACADTYIYPGYSQEHCGF